MTTRSRQRLLRSWLPLLLATCYWPGIASSWAQTKIDLKTQSKPPGANGQLLFNNAGTTDAEDPVVSYSYTNLLNAASATATQTSATVRVAPFGGFGTLYVTYASITGSPAGCTLQLKNADSLGNLINNGAAIATTPSNGTTSSAINSGVGLQTTAQIQVIYACTTYPTAGTLSVDYVPGLAVGVVSSIPLPAGTNSIGTVRVNPLTSCGSTIFDSGITTLPTTEAAVTAAATCVQAIYVNNLTASAQTFSIKDNQATPVVYVNNFSLPANSNMLLSFGGIKFAGGVRWVATTASSVNAQILGFQ